VHTRYCCESKQFRCHFIHREASPLGPPIFEWYLKKVIRKRIIYDFDDAIWKPNTSTENKLIGWLKASWKIKWICKWSDNIAAGNEFLLEYAKKNAAGKVVMMPTVIDTDIRYVAQKKKH
jgi:hypothetical protein